MARIDSILSIMLKQGANELRVGTDKEPKILSYGAQSRITLPATPDGTLHDLLGDILSAEREAALKASNRLEVVYESEALGSFRVTLSLRSTGGVDAVLVRTNEKKAMRAARPAPSKLNGAAGPVQAAPTPAVQMPEPSSGAASHLLARAAAMKASDLHLADGELPTVRINDRLHRLDGEPPADVSSALGLDEPTLQRLARGESYDFGIDVPLGGRARVHVFQAEGRRVAAVRLLPGEAPSLASLRMPVPLDEVVDLPHGLVIVCGATGAGKSTTLAALAQEAIRRRSIVLSTLEDPIEYALVPGQSLVRRREIGRDVPSFASGLRDALRQDPDLLLVGEMRDPDSISLALTAAETGHLVLASMHSRSTSSAIERIVDAYPPERQQQIRVQLADALRVVIAQWLLPVARGEGRVPAIELLRVNHAVAAMIREGKTAQIATALQSGKREGMLALERCLADRVQAGDVREEDAKAVANDSASLTMYLNARGA